MNDDNRIGALFQAVNHLLGASETKITTAVDALAQCIAFQASSGGYDEASLIETVTAIIKDSYAMNAETAGKATVKMELMKTKGVDRCNLN